MKCAYLENGAGTMRRCLRSKQENTVVLEDLNTSDKVFELKTVKMFDLGSVRVMLWPFFTQLYTGLS